MVDKMASKKEIRDEMRARRMAVRPEERASASRSLCANLLENAVVSAAARRGGMFAIYLATRDELDLEEFAEALWAMGARVAVPCWDCGRGAYSLVELTKESAFAEGRHGVREPVGGRTVDADGVDVWIVPGLAFTREGARLGYGGGWYDRMLVGARPDAAVIGVAHGFQIVDELPQEAHDRRLTGVVSADRAKET